MKTRCRPFQVAWMEILDKGDTLPPEAIRHLAECPDCGVWVQYLEAERQAAARWTPPATPARAWTPVPLRRGSTGRLFWAWALAGLTLVALGVGLWREVYRPLPLPADADLRDALTFWTDWDVSTETFDPDGVPSYLEHSGLWWTEADLQALEQVDTSPSGQSRPLDSTDSSMMGYDHPAA
ncbi:MAG: hypothetical protein NZ742_05465 [Acidobacteria bacterium]|nr:hypothetical protein [Acidobacteriota bacterium]MDW7984302.1 hypothetical protein [Acidobacteriota bacterium]